MKTNPAARSAFFHPRALLGFAFCSIGLLLALLAFALYPGATARAQGSPQKNSSAQDNVKAIQPSAPLGGPTLAGQLIISEFRLRGPSGANDEFIELYNTTGADLTAQAADGSAGLAIAASDRVTRCVVQNGTVIPAGGHFLCVNSVAYSLGSYPSGGGSTATGDRTYTADIPDNAGIAIFNTSLGGASFSLATVLDAVGAITEGDTVFREGAGLPVVSTQSVNYSWVRRLSGGCTGAAGGTSGECITVALLKTTSGPISTQPQDSNNNSADFIFVDTNGTSTGGGQRLGAPGPQNLSSQGVVVDIGEPPPTRLLDSCAFETAQPNYVRDPTSGSGTSSTFGTVDIRRTYTNESPVNITRLRFRVVDLTTFPAIGGMADLRPLSSSDLTATLDQPPCNTGASSVTLHGTTLEEPPTQPNGGGYNSSLSVNAVTLANSLASGASIDVRFLLGVQQNGVARFCVVAETEPATPSIVSCFTPTDITPSLPRCTTTIFSQDFDNVPGPALPVGWTSTFINGDGDCTVGGPPCAGGGDWITDIGSLNSDSVYGSAFHNNPSCVTDSSLETTFIAVKSTVSQVTFRNRFKTEAGFDGGVLEISLNGGAFTDIITAGGSFVSGGYTANISSSFLSPIGGRPAWTGNSAGFITTQAFLPAAAAGTNVKLRFRMATDCNVGVPGGGWNIDNVTVTDGCARALNISTRMQVETGNNVLIGGFILTGTSAKQVAVRGIGPSLVPQGIPDALADPTLELRTSNGSLITQNDNWQDDASQAMQLSNLGLAPQDPHESGIVATLLPNASYTAVLAGKNNGTGVGLVEVYDVTPGADSQLANISTRGFVRTGSNVMIGGFILGSDSYFTRVIVRGIGPTLAQFGLNPVLADPTLELHDVNGTLLIANDNWQDDPMQADQLTFFGLAPGDPSESGIVTALPLGTFTAILAGKNGGTGIGLIEIYNVH